MKVTFTITVEQTTRGVEVNCVSKDDNQGIQPKKVVMLAERLEQVIATWIKNTADSYEVTDLQAKN